MATARFAPGFRRLWAATFVSGLGDGSRLAALAVLAATLTDDPLEVALVTVAARAPWVLVGPFAGALADVLPLWRTMWLCDVARAAVMTLFVALLLTGHVSVPVLVVVSFVLSSVETLAENLAQAAVPEVTGSAPLESANSRIMGGQLVATEFIGAPLGTALFVVTAALPFAVDAVTFTLAAVLVMTVRPAPGTDGKRSGARRPGGVWRGAAEGARWLWRHRDLRTMCLLIALLNFCLVAVMGIAVLYAVKVLHITPGAYGTALVVIGAGGLAGVLLAPRCVAALGRGGTLKLAFALCPAPFLIAGLTSDPLLAGGGLTLVGASVSLATVVTTSVRQEVIPPPLFGRVNGAYRLIVNGVSPVGGFVGGLVAGAFGLRAPFLLAGAALAVGALVALRRPFTTEAVVPAGTVPDEAAVTRQNESEQ
ncbi:MFS transporter [Streptomyces sp. enrichment culture]|uniref:MFS transporter n=1 Tax=Streptomyces sp. enrichment culture TaxID=1795815 RepID=UPI003F5571FC